MIEEADKCGDCALKVDVVFPKRVVGVNKQRLAGWEAGHESRIQAAVAILQSAARENAVPKALLKLTSVKQQATLFQ
jgi:hypothetical protein